jgi:hypothetical protein
MHFSQGELMSAPDFWAGRQAANIANRSSIAERNPYADELKRQLKGADLDFAKAESGRIGFAHLLKIVSEELRRIDPNNPLVQKDVQLTILHTKVAEKASELGYRYDEKNGTIVGERKNAV